MSWMTIRSIRRRKARMKTMIFALLVSLLMPTTPLLAGESVVFTGLPKIKISEGGVNRT
jgi:hypothetical protein